MLFLDTDYDTLYRNRFSGKSRNRIARETRKLEKLGSVELGWARSDDERSELLKIFFKQTFCYRAKQRIHNHFEDSERHAFHYDMARHQNFGASAALEFAYLKISGNPVAISSGVFYGDTFMHLSTMLDDGPTGNHVPDTLLLHFQIEEACRRGLNYFDMGSGDEPYKDEWCDIDVPLFDSAIALDERHSANHHSSPFPSGKSDGT